MHKELAILKYLYICTYGMKAIGNHLLEITANIKNEV